MGDIGWVTVFVDLPAESFDEAADFWARALRSTRSAARGDAGQFATLLPDAGGDAYVRLQRHDGEGSRARVHLDVHVADVTTTVGRATSLGARSVGAVVDGFDVEILASPAGLLFCVVDHHGEREVPPPIDIETPHRLDQVCIDVPPGLFSAECDFWAGLTGWDLLPALSEEFAALDQPEHIPLRLLIQRLGADDGALEARAHLDISCGADNEVIAERHVAIGARRIGEGARWIVLRDPTDQMTYCVTQRQPR